MASPLLVERVSRCMSMHALEYLSHSSILKRWLCNVSFPLLRNWQANATQVNHTGIGGLTLGGGYGYLNGVHGLVIDNLASAEVVLADGSIVIASKSDNPDLFWALRGAGTSFGIVTKFCYRAYEQGPVWAATLVLATTQLGEVIEAANGNLALRNENSVVLVAIAAPPPALRPVVMVVLFYNGPESEAMSHYESFLKMEVVTKTMSVM